VWLQAPTRAEDEADLQAQMTRARRFILLVVGLVSLALGGIGVFVPLLPTTPLVLLAAFAFANSSETLHRWLLDHDLFGPLIDNWRRHRAISRTAKAMSVLSMVAILVMSWLLGVAPLVFGVQALVLGCVAAYILTRPSLPPN
jgi:uncharacterized membrane protein YbaN (DUF454 family)